MASFRYCAPFAFLAPLPLGVWLGGAWTFAAAIAIPFGLTVLDSTLGKDGRLTQAPANPALSWIPRITILLQLALTAWLASRMADSGTSLIEAVGLTLSNGLTTGVFGLVSAHEMIHSGNRSDRGLGFLFLGSVLYAHFAISHVKGHHRRAATYEDPATARLGENLYAFFYRSIVGQFRQAWQYEPRRVIGLVAIEAAMLVAIGLASSAAFAFVIANAAIAILLLETFNYVAHFGLVRGTLADGSVEPLGPQHSWNSSNRMNNAALFNMGRHSDHHRHAERHYPQLQRIRRAPELPSGFAAAMITALVPPLWGRVMEPRVLACAEDAGRAAVPS